MGFGAGSGEYGSPHLLSNAGAQAAPRLARVYVTLSAGYEDDKYFVVNHVPGSIEKITAIYGIDSVTLGCTTISDSALEMLYRELQSRKEKK